VEYGVKQNDSYLSGGLEPVTVEFAGGTATDAINYGYLPQVSNLNLRTWSAWIYNNAAPITTSDVIMGVFSDEAGTLISLTTDRKIQVYQKVENLTYILSIWQTPLNSVPLTTWTHILITHDKSNSAADPATPPIVYINGVAQTLTVTNVGLGAMGNETGCSLIIGNWNTNTKNYDRSFDGKIFDPRVYPRILTAAEVTTLYNGGVPDETLVTDGLVFQGFSTYADRPLAAGTVLTSTDRLTENIIRAVGVPNGSPVIRANP